MLDWFEWNGVKSTVYGIYVTEQPAITLPAERVTYTDIPGRSGSLAVTEGTDVYADLTLTMKCFVKDMTRLGEISAWLKGSGKVTFANRTGGFYYGRVNNQIPFDKVVRGRPERTLNVIFRCKPFFYESGAEDVVLTETGFVTQTGCVVCEPVITVTGSGDITLMVGTQIVELRDVDGSIVIDSEMKEAYKGTTLQNEKMTGEFPLLQPGANAVNWSGNVASVRIKPNRRTL